jgi:hypothetical protein
VVTSVSAVLAILAILATTLLSPAGSASAAECSAPKLAVATVLAMRYCADPAFDSVIARQVARIRQEVRARRQAGHLIIYASTPISPRGGGDVAVNVEIAASVKIKLEREYGGAVWVLDPATYQMPGVDGTAAGGGEYMVMWTAVLAGEDGSGKDFDAVHFTGPGDMRAFFRCGQENVGGCIDRYVTARAGTDPKFRQEVAEDAQRRQAFMRYYALRASAAFSTGAHDEWNIVVKINRKRPLGEQIAMFFDGRPVSPVEMELEVSPGYGLR